MKILQKIAPQDGSKFQWVDFDYLPNSKGFKFEIYLPEGSDMLQASLALFVGLFHDLKHHFWVRPFQPDTAWGDYCLETWDFENETFDYQLEGKSEEVAAYLSLLLKSEIEPSYLGFCKCLNWEEFVYVTNACVMSHKAPYGMIFYHFQLDCFFYFHHSGSIGFYYQHLGNEISEIIEKAQKKNYEIRLANDPRVQELIKS